MDGLARSLASFLGLDEAVAGAEDEVPPCPICLEPFDDSSDHGPHSCVSLACCGQELCRNCGENLGRCPYCRTYWQEVDTLVPFDISSPVFTAAGAAGAAGVGLFADGWVIPHMDTMGIIPTILLGTMAVMAATSVVAGALDQEPGPQEQPFRIAIASHRHLHFKEAVSWQVVARQLFRALRWSTAPSFEPLPLPAVLPGVSPDAPRPVQGRSRGELLEGVRALLLGWPEDDHEEGGSALEDSLESTATAAAAATAAPASALERLEKQQQQQCATLQEAPAALDAQLWVDLVLCFVLWLEYTPVLASLGSCHHYGSPPLHLCTYSRWRQDLRCVISSLARRFSEDRREPSKLLSSSAEAGQFCCLLGGLDFILSWDSGPIQFGSSDVLDAEWYTHSGFCRKVNGLILDAWEEVQSTKEAVVGPTKGFVPHVVQTMARRDVPTVW